MYPIKHPLHVMKKLPMFTAHELRRLPKGERARFLAAQSAGAESLYRKQPQILNDCVDSPIYYAPTDHAASD